MAIRIAAIGKTPIPEPAWDDEYSYLVGADTFASGRLTNPPHPMWVHFETFHINWLPTYCSKFPPAQAALLAFGQVILGHPWYGQWISFGLMCAAICWMLQGWMPPVYAFLGALLGAAQVGIFRYWMDSYYAGALPAIGGCLVMGAVARLSRGATSRAVLAGSCGLVILANSRPYEGLVLAIGAMLALVWWRRRNGRPLSGLMSSKVIVPFVTVCGVAVCWMGYYNYRTTGNPLVMPYSVNSKIYEANPQFWLLPGRPIPTYRHPVLQGIWAVWTRDYYVTARKNPLLVVKRFIEAAKFFWSRFLFAAVLASLFVARSRKVWAAIGALGVLFAGLLMEVGFAPHYFAPGVFLMLIPAMYAVRWMRVSAKRFGPALVLLFTAMAFGKAFQEDTYHKAYESPSRREIIRNLTAQGGRHVVYVRWAPERKIVMFDIVYNSANIDASLIVWARYMGEPEDRELMRYYPDRKHWILEADASPMVLQPYR
jgi:hypothetical protein